MNVIGEVMSAAPKNVDYESREFLQTATTAQLNALYEKIRHRWTQSLWIPTSLQLSCVALLVHYTGGPFDSPIAVIPAAMVTTAMLISSVPHMDVPDGWWTALRYSVRAIVHFKWALSLMVLTYVALVVAFEVSPAKHTPIASNAEKGLVLSIATLFTTVVTFIARAGLRPDDEPSDSKNTKTDDDP